MFTCPNGHSEEYLRVDNYYEVAYCSHPQCGEGSYYLEDLIKVEQIPFKYQMVNNGKGLVCLI